VKKSYDYDLIVIGAGIAGMVSAVTANSLGKQVAVIERSKVGGNCTNLTCIPSKALIHLSHVSRSMSSLDRLGLLALPACGLDRRKVMAHIRTIVQKAYEKDLPETFEAIGIDVIPAQASFMDDHRLRAGDRVLSAEKFIIASGTVPFIPAIEGLEGIDYLTNETLYQLEEMPRSLIILGGGVDGLEYASAFGFLGVQTTLVEMAPRLLPSMDLELVHHLLRTLRAEGIKVLTGAKVVSLRQRQDQVVLAWEGGEGTSGEIQAERLLVAVGRKPDLEALSLEQAHVSYNARGIITDDRLQTSASHIYACGDIVGPYQLASSAEAQAIVAATNAVLPIKRRVDYRNNIYVVFTEPPLASIGLTEAQAHEAVGEKLKVYRFEYAGMRRALIDGSQTGVAKILCDGRGRIIGAHILGEGAGEVIHEIQIIRAFHKRLRKLNVITHAYPTYAQAIVGRASQLAFLDHMAGSLFVRIALWLLPGCANRLNLARDRLAESNPPASGIKSKIPSETAGSAIGLSGGIKGRPAARTENACRIESVTGPDASFMIDIHGSLTGACEKDLERAFDEGLEKTGPVILNLSGLVHIDMEGASLLAVGAARAARNNRQVSAMGLQDIFRDVFHLTRLDETIMLPGDEREAVNGQTPPEQRSPAAPGWAGAMDSLSITGIPAEAMNINVEGRHITGPADGFGQLWDKRYRLRLTDTDFDPRQIVTFWKGAFPSFWPKGNRVFTSGNAALVPGTGAVLNLSLPGGLTLATGVLVAYADDTSFSFMTIGGHMLSGWIIFSSFYEDSATIIQVHPLFRASDPLMEMGFRFGAASQEDKFWQATLLNLARGLGTSGRFEQRNTLIDPCVNWQKAGNLLQNAAIRSSLHMPLHLLRKALSPGIRRKG